MPEQFNSKSFRGQGKVFLADKAADGAPAGLVFIGDLSSAELTPSIARTQVIENVTGSNNVSASAIKSVEYGISISMRSIRKDHLAIALGAVLTDKVGASVTDESVIAYLDKFVKLEHNKLSSVVVTHNSGVPTYVEGTDYVDYPDEGMIEILSTGAITEAQELFVDYSYAGQYHVKVDPDNIDKYIVFAGLNTMDNDKQTRCELYKCRLDPSVLSFITDEATDMPLSGVLLRDTSRPPEDQLYSWKVES